MANGPKVINGRRQGAVVNTNIGEKVNLKLIRSFLIVSHNLSLSERRRVGNMTGSVSEFIEFSSHVPASESPKVQ